MSNSSDTFVTLVKKYVGCSLHVRKDDLATLVCRGVDDPD